MDLRLGAPSRARILPRREEGLRAVIEQAMEQAMDQAKDQAPRAEAVAARCVERTRPVWSWLAREWRRLGTAAAILLIGGLLLHATFGANGMVIYRQKRAEMQSLKNEVDRLQKENSQYVDQIKSLKSDPAAIEKEAREQLHYTKPGEVVYVAPDPPQKPPTGRAQNEKYERK
jgi:cell division protein FtsB